MKKQIKNLNQAYIYFIEALKLIKDNIKSSQDIDTRIWQLEKAIKNLNKSILQQLKRQHIDEEFSKIIKKFS